MARVMISSYYSAKPIVMKIEIELYPADSVDPVVTTASSVSVTNDAGGEVSFKIEDWTHQCDDKVSPPHISVSCSPQRHFLSSPGSCGRRSHPAIRVAPEDHSEG